VGDFLPHLSVEIARITIDVNDYFVNLNVEPAAFVVVFSL